MKTEETISDGGNDCILGLLLLLNVHCRATQKIKRTHTQMYTDWKPLRHV